MPVGYCLRCSLGSDQPMTAQINFVRQQGFRDAGSDACAYQYPALMWQPRLIGIFVLIGLVIQSWPYFLALSALLWWNVALPQLNPFDALYNRLVCETQGPVAPGTGTEAPPVCARHGRDLHARDQPDAPLWLARVCLDSRRTSARRSGSPDFRPILPRLIRLLPRYRAGRVRQSNPSMGSNRVTPLPISERR